MKLSLRTDAAGEARVWWTLGSANNRVCVTSPVLGNAVFFCASALPHPARQLNLGSGNNQKVETGALAPEPLRVWASDGLNPAVAVPVTFRVVQGGGSLVPGGRDGAVLSQLPDSQLSTGIVVATGLTGHASVGLIAGPDGGQNVIEATFPGQFGLPVTFIVYGVARDPARPGSFTGLILDNTSRPVGGAVCTLATGTYQLSTTSDSQGRFRFEGVPGGLGHLHVNGRTAHTLFTNAVPTNSFPSLSYSVVTVANAENSLPTPVLLPRLNPANAVTYYGTNDLVLTCQGIEGLKFTIQANSMTDEHGNRVTPANPAVVSLDQVHHDDVPMPMPDGVAPPFAWTFQPGGAHFDAERPVKVEYPNMSGLAPGSIAYFLSFNHDTERFEIVASGSVTPDGSTIVTDPGSGITISGWGCN
ncbi:MAG TPA: carboxypeptidase-like regulatory domain-containing protein, partial [Verrucomicrobiota bacterium]|nr:carboxypeptidase-like regulatory domain-containing protein [Verrucomicrobiota bacterium]